MRIFKINGIKSRTLLTQYSIHSVLITLNAFPSSIIPFIFHYLTLFSKQEGVETQVIDREVEPALTWHSTLPVAARVIVHQFLLLRHPKQLPHLQLCLPKLPTILVFLCLTAFILLSNDALHTNRPTEGCLLESPQVYKPEAGLVQCERLSPRAHLYLALDKSSDVFIVFKNGEGLQ